MDGRTSSSSRGRPNPRAGWSVVFGILAVASVPAGVGLARASSRVSLLQSSASIAVGVVLGLVAVSLARGARGRIEITLGRAGGGQAARLGRLLGILGVLIAVTAALAVGFYGLLKLFAG